MPFHFIKNKRFYQSLLAAFCLFFILPCNLYAQREPKHDSGYYAAYIQKRVPKHDSSYYTTYLERLTTRVYFSKKYTSFSFPALASENDLQYRPNSKLTLGVGATYNNLSLNLSYGFGVLNPDDEKGETKSIDLEIHIYPNKWAIDFLGIHHKGMHINPKGYAAVNADNYYYRPDAIMTLVGLGVYRVINRNRFSYNAAMIQSEWQRKSAGSFLYGGEFYYGSLNADSGLVPKIKEGLFTQAGINKIHFYTIGAGIGYAYTLVVHEHFYATGSLITNLDINFSTEQNSNIQNKKTAVAPSFNYKTAIGYNSNDWDISANWAANALWVKGASSADAYTVPTGNYRIILAKRINIKRR